MILGMPLHTFLHASADDTSLTVCGKDLDGVIHHINIELPKIYDWLCANKLTLNCQNTLDYLLIVIFLGMIILSIFAPRLVKT